MNILKGVLYIFSLFISLSSVCMAAVDSSWLMGVWELSDKSKTEFLEFKGKKNSYRTFLYTIKRYTDQRLISYRENCQLHEEIIIEQAESTASYKISRDEK